MATTTSLLAAATDGGVPADVVAVDASPSDGGRWRSPLDAAAIARVDWLHVPFSKYETSIVGYRPAVRSNNLVAIGDAAVPFASYIIRIHNRLHGAFNDSFLAALDRFEETNPLNDPRLTVRIELVLDRHGRIDRLGVVRASGQRPFDLAALEAMTVAGPFGETPARIRSPDGKVYVHWELHRDGTSACSAMNARPYILSDAADADAAAL